MAEHIIMFVLERLAELIIDEVNFLHGFKLNQIQQAKTELQLMRCFLKDADSRHEDERVRLWIDEIKEAAYDLEDLIGTLALKVGSRRKRSGRKNLVNKFSKSIVSLEIGLEVEKVSTRISKLRLSLQKYGIKELMIIEGNERQKELRQTYAHVIENDVVGFEENVDELVKYLTSSQGSDFVAICGMGGLGKTTLAKMVYHNDRIRRHFDCFAWAYVSQRCQTVDVWDVVLVELVSQSMEEKKFIKEMKSHQEIAKRLYEMQRERKCLIILDDIWTSHSWSCLKAAFPEHDTKSKILLTTRNKYVASKANRNCIVHEPRCLNGEQSWELLQKIIAHAQRDDPSQEENSSKIKNIGLKMLRHCSGLPLAITMLGGLLSTKHTLEEWEMLEKNIETYIMKGKDRHEPQFSGMFWVLDLSYKELPYHLKPCFLHLSQFPDDFEIKVKELCRIWIAEGLISVTYPRRNSLETIEDASYNCLVELVERCMVQVGEWGSTGRIKTCRVHDIMREFCLLKVEEENFLQIIKDRHNNEPMQHSFLSGTNLKQKGKIRRLAVYLDNDSVDQLLPFGNTKDLRLRSIIYFNPSSKSPLMKSIKKLFNSLSNSLYTLRVLKFENLTYVGKLPKEIGDLINLRFLSFKGGSFEMLPSSLGKLRGLQTLDLRLKQECMIPNVFRKLEGLRHLYLPHAYVIRLANLNSPKRLLQLHNLRNLQTLVNISMESCDIEKLGNLRKLVICARNNQNLGEMFNNIKAKFSQLLSLTLHNESDLLANVTPIVLLCPSIYKLSLTGKILKLPESNEFSPNLIKLKLEGTRFLDDPMPMLEKLPNLRILGLFMNAFIGSEMVCSRGGFSRLESLSMYALRHLNEWKVEEGALCSLRYLRIEGCIKLRTAPDGLKHVSNLKALMFKLMSREFTNRVGEGGADFWKVQHVPSIVFLR